MAHKDCKKTCCNDCALTEEECLSAKDSSAKCRWEKNKKGCNVIRTLLFIKPCKAFKRKDETK